MFKFSHWIVPRQVAFDPVHNNEAKLLIDSKGQLIYWLKYRIAGNFRGRKLSKNR